MEKNNFGQTKIESMTVKNWLIVITYALGLLMVVLNMKSVFSILGSIFKILTPFIIGFVIAYVLNRPLKFIETQLFAFMDKSKSPKIRKLKKPCSVLLTYLLLLGLIAGFLGIVIPQIATSVTSLVANMSAYSATASEFMQNIASRFNLSGEIWQEFNSVWAELSKTIANVMSTVLPSFVSFLTSVTTGITKTFVGTIVSVYFLVGQDKIISQVKRVLYAFFPKSFADKSVKIARLSHKTFGSFIIGQLTVAAILGLLCFISMTILRMPYAMLISVIVGVSNIIPYFGPFLGAIPGVFILFTIKPMQSLIFIILIVILQQIDNNFISPKIVGGNLGLSGLWVLFAITAGGGLFGIAGMVIGAPTFAVIYKLVGEAVSERLKKKKIIINGTNVISK
ncbi:MAG: AI-2E family transporter [Oscillospiraceae bacterium]